MKLQRYFDISQSADRASLERRLITFADDFGFGLVNAVVVVDRRGDDPVFLGVGNTPTAYTHLSLDREAAKRNPVMQRLKASSIPFTYDKAFYVAHHALDLWERQAAFGYANGLAVASHLRDGRHFLLGVDRDQALPANEDARIRLLASLHLLAAHAQDAALRLLGAEEHAGEPPALTARELEILRWTKEGKSAWVVGRILSVSQSTVNFHVRNVCRKFGAVSKHQAVLQALAYGLID